MNCFVENGWCELFCGEGGTAHNLIVIVLSYSAVRSECSVAVHFYSMWLNWNERGVHFNAISL